MNLSKLTPAKGAIKKRTRVGRGHSAGRGKTCGRGQNGQGSRAGSGAYVGFEGGQMPLQRRVPKRGFHNKWRVAYRVVNVASLARLEGVDKVTPEVLREHGLVKGRGPVKVLGVGELSQRVHVCAHAFSKSAVSKIESAGGVVEVLQ